ncbi:MAG: hypothetical protein IPG07_04755 [Crocinitomicaceae bacterium]|nr:hypothetical protein [Crocinitomicaceae bacterium]
MLHQTGSILEDGQNGIGLTTINTNANSSTTTYSVAATTTSGCNSEALISGLVVHQNPNAAPTLQSVETHYYVQQGEEICIDFYSADATNEFTFIDITHTYGPSSSTFSYSENLFQEHQTQTIRQLLFV